METVSSSLQKMETGSIHVVRGAIVFPDRRSGRPPAGASRPVTLLGGWTDGRTCTWRTRACDRSFRVPWLSSAEQVHPPRPLAASARGRQRAREDARRYGGATCWRAGGPGRQAKRAGAAPVGGPFLIQCYVPSKQRKKHLSDHATIPRSPCHTSFLLRNTYRELRSTGCVHFL